MLKVGNKLESFEVGAGEPFILSVQFRDAQNEALDMTDRRVVLSFYKTSGRGLFDSIDGVTVGVGLMQFVRAGEFTETLSGEGLTVSLSERLLQGRETLATGTLKVIPTANPVESYGPLIGRAEVRATVYLDNLGSVTKWGDLMRLPYASAGAPVFTTPASINSDGTPQVGEQLTGVDGVVANGSITARQWLLAGTAISGATASLYTPTQTGDHTYRVTALGTNGATITSSSTVTVAAATVTSTPTPSNQMTAGGESMTAGGEPMTAGAY